MKNSTLILTLVLFYTFNGYSQNEPFNLNSPDFINNKIESVLKKLPPNNQQMEYVIPVNNNSRGSFWKLDDQVIEQYNAVTYQWETNRTVYEYDSDWRDTNEIIYKYNLSTSNYESEYKRTFTYNADNLLVKYEFIRWDPVNSQWVDSVKYTYWYNNLNLLAGELEQHWNEGLSGFENIEKITIFRNALGYSDSALYASYIDSTSTWYDYIKVSSGYFQGGRYDSTNLYLKNYYSSEWELRTKVDYWYNSNELLVQRLDSSYYMPDSLFTPFMLFTYSYDVNQNLSTSSYGFWSLSDSVWDTSSVEFSMYNLNVTQAEIIAPAYRKVENNMLVGIDTYNPFYGVVDRRIILHYSNIYINSIETLNSEPSSVYPNPASDYLVLDANYFTHDFVFEIYNTLGVRVLEQETNNGSQVDISLLEPGLYYYNISDGTTLKQGSFVKL